VDDVFDVVDGGDRGGQQAADLVAGQPDQVLILGWWGFGGGHHGQERAVQRCQDVQVRTWCSSRAASSLPAAKDSSIVQRRPATLTSVATGTGVGE
jgi:hypothetical protein